MIQLTRINNASMVLNSDLIEHIETTPDTVVSLTTGQKYMVRESADQIIDKVVQFRAAICERLRPCTLNPRPHVAQINNPDQEGERDKRRI